MESLVKFIKGFGYAARGIADTIITERNMRVHLVCVIYMYSILGLTDWFVLSRTDWALLLVMTALVLAGELVNTAIESVVDLVTGGERKELAKKAKDAAAGSVLVEAIIAVCVGLCVLLQKDAFIAMYDYFRTHIISLIVFALSLILAVLFMLRGVPFVKGKKK